MAKAMRVKTTEGLSVAKRIVVAFDMHNNHCEQLRKQFESDMTAASENYAKQQQRNMALLCKAEDAPFPAERAALDGRYFLEHGVAFLFDTDPSDDDGDDEPVGVFNAGGETLQ